MKAEPLKQHIKKTRSIESLADYCRVTTGTASNRFRANEIPDKYKKYIVEWIEINNDEGIHLGDKIRKDN